MIPFEFEDKYIYKYVPFSINTLKLLIKGQLWLGYPNNLNDPFEGEFHLDDFDELPTEEFISAFYKHYLKLPDYKIPTNQIHENFKSDLYNYLIKCLKSENGVSCFSLTPYNILMWSHYADSHEGLCLIFDKSELMDSLKETYQQVKIDNITYCESLPTIKPIYNNNRIYFKNNDKVLLHKFIDWNKENELRIYIKYDSEQQLRTIPFNKKSLKGIILGEKVDRDDLNTLVHLIKQNPSYDVKWGQAKKNLHTKRMDIDSCDFSIDFKLKIVGELMK